MQITSGCHIISSAVRSTTKRSSRLQRKSIAFNIYYCIEMVKVGFMEDEFTFTKQLLEKKPQTPVL